MVTRSLSGSEVVVGIRRLPSGGYQARLQVDGIRRGATFETRVEAEEWLVITQAKAITGTLPQQGVATALRPAPA